MFSRKGLTVDILNNELRLILYCPKSKTISGTFRVISKKKNPQSNDISGSSISLFNRRNIYSMQGDTIEITLL